VTPVGRSTELPGSGHWTGALHVTHNDGSQIEVTVGDAYVIEPGHNAWVVGEDPAVLVEFESADTYGRNGPGRAATIGSGWGESCAYKLNAGSMTSAVWIGLC
jgi:hypothetical protein